MTTGEKEVVIYEFLKKEREALKEVLLSERSNQHQDDTDVNYNVTIAALYLGSLMEKLLNK